jgi:hypothetical protein
MQSGQLISLDSWVDKRVASGPLYSKSPITTIVVMNPIQNFEPPECTSSPINKSSNKVKLYWESPKIIDLDIERSASGDVVQSTETTSGGPASS